jgi:flagellin-like protein
MTHKLRGIEPVIATIIILAITIAVAVAVIGWITGLFGASVGGTEQLQILPDSEIEVSTAGGTTTAVLRLHVVNKAGDVTIYKVEIVGAGEVSDLSSATEADGDTTAEISISGTELSIVAGADTVIEITPPSTVAQKIVPGTTYTVKVYTKNGNVFTATIQAKQA